MVKLAINLWSRVFLVPTLRVNAIKLRNIQLM